MRTNKCIEATAVENVDLILNWNNLEPVQMKNLILLTLVGLSKSGKKDTRINF